MALWPMQTLSSTQVPTTQVLKLSFTSRIIQTPLRVLPLFIKAKRKPGECAAYDCGIMHQATSDMERIELYAGALTEYGTEAQKMMLIEEIGELLNAFAKFPRGRAKVDDVIEELADVSIMVEQMALLYGWSRFESIREQKLKRLGERLDKLAYIRNAKN